VVRRSASALILLASALGLVAMRLGCESRTGRMVAFDPPTEKMETVPIPCPGAIVRHMETDSTRGRIWLALSGTGRLGKIELGRR
jgi:streptogramin lyase